MTTSPSLRSRCRTKGSACSGAASFWTVRDGSIVSGREYWIGVGAEEPPVWRLPYVERV